MRSDFISFEPCHRQCHQGVSYVDRRDKIEIIIKVVRMQGEKSQRLPFRCWAKVGVAEHSLEGNCEGQLEPLLWQAKCDVSGLGSDMTVSSRREL